jgi:hypothetical protein
MSRDLQERWSREWELNPRPADYESAALPLSYLGPLIIKDLFYYLASSQEIAIKLPSFVLSFFGALHNFRLRNRGLVRQFRHAFCQRPPNFRLQSSLSFPGVTKRTGSEKRRQK